MNTDSARAEKLTAKASGTYFDRNIEIPAYMFDGRQISSFTEVAYTHTRDKNEWVAGLNLWTDDFKEKNPGAVGKRDYTQTTAGAFIQDNWLTNSWLNIEAGLRADHVFSYGWAILPRLSALFKVSEQLSSRLSGGFGYKAPTMFTEDAERIQYRDIIPVDKDHNKLERSYGLNWDVNYVTTSSAQRVVCRKPALLLHIHQLSAAAAPGRKRHVPHGQHQRTHRHQGQRKPT